MSVPLRSHVSVRSYYFRELCAKHDPFLGDYTLEDFRPLWRQADAEARTWLRRATNRWNDQTKRWEQRR